MARRHVFGFSILWLAACAADVGPRAGGDAPSTTGGKADVSGEERSFTPHFCGMNVPINSEFSSLVFDICFDFGDLGDAGPEALKAAEDTSPELVRVGRTGPNGVSHEVYEVVRSEPYDEGGSPDTKFYLATSYTEDTESWLAFEHHWHDAELNGLGGLFEGVGILPTGEEIYAMTVHVTEDSPLYVCDLEPRAEAFGGTQDPGQNRTSVVLPEAYHRVGSQSVSMDAFGLTYHFTMWQSWDGFEVRIFAPMEVANFRCEYGSSCERQISVALGSASEPPVPAFDFGCVMHDA